MAGNSEADSDHTTRANTNSQDQWAPTGMPRTRKKRTVDSTGNHPSGSGSSPSTTSTVCSSPFRISVSSNWSARVVGPQLGQQVAGLVHRLAVDVDDHVAGEDTGVGRGAAVGHADHQHPGLGVDPVLRGELRRERPGLDAEVGVLDVAVGQQLVGDVDRHHRGDGEPDRHGSPRRRDVGDVDADDLAGGPDSAPPELPGGDRRVGLEQESRGEGAPPPAGHAALEAGDDAGGHGVLEAERVADGHRQLAHRRGVLSANSGRLQVVPVGPDHRQVNHRVGGHSPRRGPGSRRRTPPLIGFGRPSTTWLLVAIVPSSS